MGCCTRSGSLYFGKDNDEVLVIHAPSRTLNPTLPQQIIDRRLAEDPEAGGAEYLAEWRSDLSDFLDRELVASAVDDVTVRSPVPAVEYQMFVDASGGRGDLLRRLWRMLRVISRLSIVCTKRAVRSMRRSWLAR